MNAFVEKLLKDRPKLHYLSQDMASQIEAYTGVKLPPGDKNWGIPDNVIQYICGSVKSDHRTIETGSGFTTVLLTALAAHHTCITIDRTSAEKIIDYMKIIGLPQDKLTLIVESSDTALPNLPESEFFDFAYIDGGHGYPMPALDWHYVDKHLRVGGMIGFDNIEIPAVHDMCEFLRRNKTYRLEARRIYPEWGNYGAEFWVKLKDESRWDLVQKNSYRRVTRYGLRDSLKTIISNLTGKRFGEWPWS